MGKMAIQRKKLFAARQVVSDFGRPPGQILDFAGNSIIKKRLK